MDDRRPQSGQARTRREVDAVLLDLDDVSGKAVRAIVESSHRAGGIPVIAITGSSGAVPSSVEFVVGEPFTLDAVIEAVRTALESRRRPPARVVPLRPRELGSDIPSRRTV